MIMSYEAYWHRPINFHMIKLVLITRIGLLETDPIHHHTIHHQGTIEVEVLTGV